MPARYSIVIFIYISTQALEYLNLDNRLNTIRPIVEQVVGELGSAISSIEIDVEIKKGIVKRYKIKGVPTLILFKSGTPLWRHTGVMPVEDISIAIKEHL